MPEVIILVIPLISFEFGSVDDVIGTLVIKNPNKGGGIIIIIIIIIIFLGLHVERSVPEPEIRTP